MVVNLRQLLLRGLVVSVVLRVQATNSLSAAGAGESEGNVKE
jgi:hypothetical protein